MSRSATRWQPTARAATSLAHGPVNPATGLTAAQEDALHRVYMLILPPYWEIPSVVAAIKAGEAEQAAKDAAAAEAVADPSCTGSATAPNVTAEPATTAETSAAPVLKVKRAARPAVKAAVHGAASKPPTAPQASEE